MKPKKPFYKRWWFIALIALFILGSCNAIINPDDSSKKESAVEQSVAPSPESSSNNDAAAEATSEDAQPEEAPAEQSEAPQESEEESVIDVDATTLIQAYKDNEFAADRDYKDKQVRVVGTMEEVNKVLGTRSVVVAGNEPYEFVMIRCYFDKNQEDRAADLVKGEQVSVLGTVEGFDQLSVIVKKCTIE